ncbi:hypothetical protein DFJ74DRAFT_660064 [Hyaloraphidium curvatum]|nr:hypothetical protein DFJ74DRAFT_660064 [Hyaloraphidium curvatum]
MNTTRARADCIGADPLRDQRPDCEPALFVAVRIPGTGRQKIEVKRILVDAVEEARSVAVYGTPIKHADLCTNKRDVLLPPNADGTVTCGVCGIRPRKDNAAKHAFCRADHLKCAICRRAYGTVAAFQMHAGKRGCTAQDCGIAVLRPKAG